MRFLPRLAASVVAAATALGLALVPAAADTSSNPAGSTSTGSVEALSSGTYGLGEFNKSAASSWNQHDTPAPPGGAKVLVFGDSHSGGTLLPIYTDDRGCMHSRNSWPAMLDRKLGGGKVIDASCWGGGLRSGHGIPFADQVRYVESLGGLGPNTTDIFVQLGFNEEWSAPGMTIAETAARCIISPFLCGPAGVAQGAVINPADVTAHSYVERSKQVIDYLRYYAPNATIHLVNYQEMSTPGDMCVRMFGRSIRFPNSPLLPTYFAAVNEAVRGAGPMLGLPVLDLEAATRGRNACGHDPLVSEMFASTPNAVGVPVHPNFAGNALTADMAFARLH